MSTLIALRLGLLVARVLPLPLLGAAAAGLWRLGGRFSPRRRVVAANLAAVAAAGGRSARPGDVFACYGRYCDQLARAGFQMCGRSRELIPVGQSMPDWVMGYWVKITVRKFERLLGFMGGR